MLKYLLIVSSIISSALPTYAQSQTFESTWGSSGFFSSYEIIRPKDNHSLYESVIYLELDKNDMNLYNVQSEDPLGSASMCGGLGCDLEKTSRIGSVTFRPEKERWLVASATGKAAFLQGSLCQFKQDYLPVLFCITKQGHRNNFLLDFPFVVKISPAS